VASRRERFLLFCSLAVCTAHWVTRLMLHSLHLLSGACVAVRFIVFRVPSQESAKVSANLTLWIYLDPLC